MTGGREGGEAMEEEEIKQVLWHACAGPLVTIPPTGSLVVYFPQGHSEHVAVSMGKDINIPVPSYPNLPSKLTCLLQTVTLHADPETDEVYARMALQPVNGSSSDMDCKDAILSSHMPLKINRPQSDFFCKTLTASDTSTHGGFSVPRRAADKIFPPLDFSMKPPAQELHARDLHGNVWNFRHIYRGQPKRHLLTTGWSSFVSAKRLLAGDSVLFIRDSKSRLLLGIRRAHRQINSIPSSVLSRDSMHIGILAAAAHAFSNNSSFTVFYNPRASHSEFAVALSKYNKGIYGSPVSPGMRFRMPFETEELGTRNYMGTITGIGDLDPVRWKDSQWRNLQVAWDETAEREKHSRVSIWEIEPVIGPFFFLPPAPFGFKRPKQADDESTRRESVYNRIGPTSFCEDMSLKNIGGTHNDVMHGFSSSAWTQQGSVLANSNGQSLVGTSDSENLAATPDLSAQLCMQAQLLQQANIRFNAQRATRQIQHPDHLSKLYPSSPTSQAGTIPRSLQELPEAATLVQKQQHLVDQVCPSNQAQDPLLQPPILVATQEPLEQLLVSQKFQPLLPSILQNQLQQSPLQRQRKLPNQQPPQTNVAVPISQEHKLNLQSSEQPILSKVSDKLVQQQQWLLPLPTLLQQPQLEQGQEDSFGETWQPLGSHHSLTQLDNHQQCTNKPRNSLAVNCYQTQQQQKQANHQSRCKKIMTDLSRNVPCEQLSNTTPPLGGAGGCFPASAVAHSVLTDDDAPSHCTSSSTNNNGYLIPQEIVRNDHNASITFNEESHPAWRNLKAAYSCSPKEENPSHCISIPRAEDFAQVDPRHTALMDYVESAASSATSNCLSQSDAQHQSSFPSSSTDHLPAAMFETTTSSDSEFHLLHAAHLGSNDFAGVERDGRSDQLVAGSSLIVKSSLDLEKKHPDGISSPSLVENRSARGCSLSSPVLSRISGTRNVGFNPTDAIDEGSSFPKRYAGMSSSPPFPRMRTYTKVYKRGAVGRSVDITRYSGYDELRRDISRMFNIGGRLEDLQQLGWKLVYVDHENDVLLVGDDPWGDFVNCVKFLKILSPQEVQQMSLEGGADVGNRRYSSPQSSLQQHFR